MTKIDFSHDPALTSWIGSANGHEDFPVQNLPLGIFSSNGVGPRAGVAIGDWIFCLKGAATAGLVPSFDGALDGTTLNALFARDAHDRLALRHKLSALLCDEANRAAVEPYLFRAADCALHLPAKVGDFTDFYVGIHHATNVGRVFRPDNPLLPNYKHIPIGYHGRSSSIRPSGVPVTRPNGQRKAPDAELPTYGPTQRLDYELELGVWIGPGNALGEPIPIGEAEERIAGLCLLNDWSARDFQVWEYQPLGPFLAKNFHSTVSPWVVTTEALAPFRIAQTARADSDPHPLPYLWDEGDQAKGALALTLEASLSTAAMREAGMAPHKLSRGPASNMYWTVAQIVTHHAANGCNLSPGDLLGTGTISAPTPDGLGSLLEITGARNPVELPTGESRFFVLDGDEISLSAHAHAEGFVSIGFGACRSAVLPAPHV